jgi:hypothetical protein
MEVHHGHHPSHKKDLKEYFLEFFMLFIAVTLGFFAENIREHYVEKEREIKYIQNIHQDLQKDIKEVDATVIAIDKKQLLADSLFVQIKDNSIAKDLPAFYYYIKNLSFRRIFENSTNGFTQLKTSGGLRLIENNEIIDKIQDYTNNLNRTLTLQDNNENNGQKYNEKYSRILNAVTSIEMNESQILSNKSTEKVNRFLKPSNPRPLVSNKVEDLNELYNVIYNIINRNKYFKIRLLEVKQSAIVLDNLIVKEYGSSFH